MSYSHPLYQGATGHMFGYQSLPNTSKGDVNLICGTYMLPEVFPELGEIYQPGAKVIHIDLNAYDIAKNHRVDLGMVYRRGKQCFRYHECGSQFVSNPKNQPYSPQVKELCQKMYLNGMGLRGIERVTEIHHTTIINWIKDAGLKLPNAP